MKTLLSCIAAIMLAASCGLSSDDKPPVPAEKMQQLLLDLHVAEVYSSMLDDSLHQSRNKNFDSLGVFYADVFAHHHITRDEFDKAIAWYKQHPAEMDSLYKNMVSKSAEMETKSIK